MAAAAAAAAAAPPPGGFAAMPLVVREERRDRSMLDVSLNGSMGCAFGAAAAEPRSRMSDKSVVVFNKDGYLDGGAAGAEAGAGAGAGAWAGAAGAGAGTGLVDVGDLVEAAVVERDGAASWRSCVECCCLWSGSLFTLLISASRCRSSAGGTARSDWVSRRGLGDVADVPRSTLTDAADAAVDLAPLSWSRLRTFKLMLRTRPTV